MVRRRKGIMLCALCISSVLVVAGCGKEKKKQKLNLTSGEEVTTEAVTPTDAGTEQEIDTEGYVTMNFWTADIPEGLIEDTDSTYNEESYGYYYFRTADEEESLTISVSNEEYRRLGFCCGRERFVGDNTYDLYGKRRKKPIFCADNDFR